MKKTKEEKNFLFFKQKCLHFFFFLQRKKKMFRFSLPLLDDAAAKTAAAAARRKAKWIDRRNHQVPHSGRAPYPVHEMPSCELCQVKFRWKENHQTHKESELHKAREKWLEQEKWWNKIGQPARVQRNSDDAALFQKFLVQRAAASGIAAEALQQSMRRANVNLGPKHSVAADVPLVKSETVEPRDQRWPASPKW